MKWVPEGKSPHEVKCEKHDFYKSHRCHNCNISWTEAEWERLEALRKEVAK